MKKTKHQEISTKKGKTPIRNRKMLELLNKRKIFQLKKTFQLEKGNYFSYKKENIPLEKG